MQCFIHKVAASSLQEAALLFYAGKISGKSLLPLCLIRKNRLYHSHRLHIQPVGELEDERPVFVDETLGKIIICVNDKKVGYRSKPPLKT